MILFTLVSSRPQNAVSARLIWVYRTISFDAASSLARLASGTCRLNTTRCFLSGMRRHRIRVEHEMSSYIFSFPHWTVWNVELSFSQGTFVGIIHMVVSYFSIHRGTGALTKFSSSSSYIRAIGRLLVSINIYPVIISNPTNCFHLSYRSKVEYGLCCSAMHYFQVSHISLLLHFENLGKDAFSILISISGHYNWPDLWRNFLRCRNQIQYLPRHTQHWLSYAPNKMFGA